MVVKSYDLLNPIKKFTIGDGHTDIIIDLEKSRDVWLFDKISNEKYLDFFSFHASSPLGFNHPSMLEDDDFLRNLKYSAINKISNSDFYTDEMSKFVDTFSKIALPHNFKHLFFIAGGSLAVENTLKAAFDWKVKMNFQNGLTKVVGSQILHFKEAFHGRSGYTLSLTNTSDPRKYLYYPIFNWPRVLNPKIKFPEEDNNDFIKEMEDKSIEEIQNAFSTHGNDIAAIIIEPIQGEGGDNHFRYEFFKFLRKISDETNSLLIYDEIQTGIGLTGKMWAFDHYPGAEPDLVSFGKKTQVCGVMSTGRIDEIDDNVFNESSRINSTWGGNIVDMVRSTKYLEIIKEDKIISNAEVMGKYLKRIMLEIQEEFQIISNYRSRGLFAAFDLPSSQLRDNLKSEMKKRKLIVLGSGDQSIRFRPPLIVQESHIDQMIEILKDSLINVI